MNLYVDREQHIKPYLGIAKTDTSKDEVLDLLNNGATAILNSVLNVNDLAKHTVTNERFDGNVCDIWCKDFPVLSVTSIKVGRIETVYTQTEDYIFDKNVVKLDGVVGGGTGYDQNKITYEAGYVTYAQVQELDNDEDPDNNVEENMPEDLKLAVLILIAGLFNQRNNQGVQTMSIQGKSVTFRNEIEVKEFQRIFERYRKIRNYAI